MADWQERVQSMIIGFVFAYMVRKLFSVIANFRAGNMRVERAEEEEDVLLVAGEVSGGDELTAALVATDEETEADGGDELGAHGESSSSFDSEAEDDAAAGSRAREIGSADEATVSGVESKDEDVVAKKDEEVDFKNEGVDDVQKTESKDVGTPGEQSLKALIIMLQCRSNTVHGRVLSSVLICDSDSEYRDSESTSTWYVKYIKPSFRSKSKEADGDFEEEFEDENEVDDWEGVESTELEKRFGAASTYADTMVAISGMNPSSEAMLQLHAFYKIATEGPCSTSQPSAFQPTARAKWNAWQKLGSMSQEEAMQKYIAVLTEINPSWYEDYRKKSKEPAKEATELKHGDHSHSSGKMDALPVLSELVTIGGGGQADTVEQGSAT